MQHHLGTTLVLPGYYWGSIGVLLENYCTECWGTTGTEKGLNWDTTLVLQWYYWCSTVVYRGTIGILLVYHRSTTDFRTRLCIIFCVEKEANSLF